MRILFKPPGQAFREIIVPNDLHTLQGLVGGGNIETVTFADNACLICNEDGRGLGLEENCMFLGVDFVGPILIVGVKGDEFTDCPLSVVMASGCVERRFGS